MKYNKPEVITLAEALRGIQGTLTKTIIHADCCHPGWSAAAAYEADE